MFPPRSALVLVYKITFFVGMLKNSLSFLRWNSFLTLAFNRSSILPYGKSPFSNRLGEHEIVFA